MIAVAGLLPMIVAGLYGGMLADAFDRRRVALIAATVTFALDRAARRPHVGAAGRPSGGSTCSRVVELVGEHDRDGDAPGDRATPASPATCCPAASALNGITVGIMVMAGPALAGVLVAFTGYAWTYTIDVVLMLSLFLGLWTLPSIRPEGEIVRPGLESLRDGWRFLKRASNIRLQFILDIIAMTFGQPLALFPAIGAVLLGGGPITTGVLTASIAVGAFISSLFSGPAGRVRHHGLGIERAILVYGGAMAAFGLVLGAAALGWFAPDDVDANTPNVVLIVAAALTLVVAGGADNISSIFRNTMVQAAVPDAIRGRLQGVFIVVVAGGPRLGALYAGVLATFTTLWFPPLLGGFVIIGLVALLVRLQPALPRLRRRPPRPTP